MIRSRFILILFLIVIAPASAFAQQSLERIHKGIVSEYGNVEHLSADELSALSPADAVLFDVREQNEFDVSHIEGAIRIDPNIDAETFSEKYGVHLQGKTAVFYCSVGRRSSRLASQLDDFILAESGAGAVNLIGGIFQWRNENRPLMSNSSAGTDQVHPYNWYWGRLIEDKDAISYHPQVDYQ